MLAMAVLAAMITIACSCPLLSLASPPAKTTPTPTKTAKPSASPSPSRTATPEYTPSQTATKPPTETATVMSTDTPTQTLVPATSTPRPPTGTPTRTLPSPTSTPGWEFTYLENSMTLQPNCGSVYLESEVANQPGEPLDGITVRLRSWDNVEYELSGAAGGHSPGKWGFSPLSPDQNRAYQAFILDIVDNRGNPVPLSEELHVDMANCSEAGQSTNIIFVSRR